MRNLILALMACTFLGCSTLSAHVGNPTKGVFDAAFEVKDAEGGKKVVGASGYLDIPGALTAIYKEIRSKFVSNAE